MPVVNPVIIMAAGKGSRMKAEADLDRAILEEAQSRPKAMIRLGQERRPLLAWLLMQLVEEGCRHACLVLAEDDEVTWRHFEAHPVPGLTLSHVRQSIPPDRSKPLGTAHAVQLALEAHPEWTGHSVTAANGDNLPPKGMFRRLFDHGCALPAFDPDHLGLPSDRVQAFAVLHSADGLRMDGITEKPSPQQVEASKWPDGKIRVSMNYFRVPHGDFLQCVREVPEHPERKERELPVAISRWIALGKMPMNAVPMAGAFLDLTHPTDIPEASRAIDGGGFALKDRY